MLRLLGTCKLKEQGNDLSLIDKIYDLSLTLLESNPSLLLNDAS